MEKKYMWNQETGTLHIVGYCCHTKGHHSDKLYFDTEQEAYNFAGRKIKPCSICEKVKEKIIKETK